MDAISRAAGVGVRYWAMDEREAGSSLRLASRRKKSTRWSSEVRSLEGWDSVPAVTRGILASPRNSTKWAAGKRERAISAGGDSSAIGRALLRAAPTERVPWAFAGGRAGSGFAGAGGLARGGGLVTGAVEKRDLVER